MANKLSRLYRVEMDLEAKLRQAKETMLKTSAELVEVRQAIKIAEGDSASTYRSVDLSGLQRLWSGD
jgi:hypothetical protein